VPSPFSDLLAQKMERPLKHSSAIRRVKPPKSSPSAISRRIHNPLFGLDQFILPTFIEQLFLRGGQKVFVVSFAVLFVVKNLRINATNPGMEKNATSQ